ncbi:MAG TPA: site-specific integrase [Pseudonocardiaceae bacterium]|nr:site-specific integrase [Pseudonocardiaceae bacterium]
MRYKVRYLDPDGRELSRSFPDRAKRQADEFLHKVENDKREGTYLDPSGGKVKFREYAEQWLAGQSFKATTRVNVPSRLKNQAYPFLGNIELGSITPTTVRNWIRWMKDHGAAQSYRHVCFVHVSAILSAAVDDRKIATNPCKARSVTKPAVGPHKVVPWTDARLKAVRLALPPLVKIAVPLGAGAGLRQGEMFGLSPDDIDRDAQVIHVVRQVQQTNSELIFCLPKRDKVRDVPLSAATLAALDLYIEMFPPASVTLPWEEADGKPATVDLIMTDDEGRAWWRQVFNRDQWRPALDRAGMTNATREDGTHALRHFYASVLLEGGVSIKALSEYLGHADPGFTLRTYTHLMPASHERTRRVIDSRIGRSDGLETAYEASDDENSSSDGVQIKTGSTGTG